MGPSSLPSPPIKVHESTLSRRSTSSSTKSCDGEFPCKRCKDDDLVCAAGIRKKMKYKKLPQGYAEVLENTQFALTVTIHKLYFMSGIAKLAHQLKEQQKENKSRKEVKDADSSVYHQTQRASLSELDYSDFKHDYENAAFSSNNAMILSPQSVTSSSDFDFAPPPPETNASATFPSQSPSISSFSSWSSISADAQPSDLTIHLLQRPGVPGSMDILIRGLQGLVESEFATINPHVLSCPNPEVMMSMGDPMIYSGYNGEPMDDSLSAAHRSDIINSHNVHDKRV
ncbi:hypothetical protein EDB81DRAFT_901408 [Dactylonectria macrodidyma]|uniref:Zn(2)-C6 fungal-type domain-containing protein n=1 Tax=Dactylonectria macrodidyma TaxID=307937 RepID=A0A9P9J0L4_9HYPO|nr:hypothetical protein EDB81DRAFT_901408 [Dactylonectria macrodidyma]